VRLTRRIFRAAILSAKEVELDAIRHFLLDEKRADDTYDGTVYRRGRIRSGPNKETALPQWEVAVYRTGRGQQPASYGAQIVLQHFKPEVILYVGVAGGDPSNGELSVGDVVVGKMVRYYERTSQKAETFTIKDESHRPNRALVSAAEYEVDESQWLDWVAGAKPNSKAIIGEIATGEKVQKSSMSGLWTAIRDKYPDVVAVETEGQGFHYSVDQVAGRGLMIRAVSDLLDNKDDDGGSIGSDDERQKLASSHAAAFAINLLANLNTTFLAGEIRETLKYCVVLKISANDIAGVIRATELLADAINDPHLTVESLEPANSFILRISTTLHSSAYASAAYKAGFLPRLIGVTIDSLQSDAEQTGDAVFDGYLSVLISGDPSKIRKLRAELLETYSSWRSATLLVERLFLETPDAALAQANASTAPALRTTRKRLPQKSRELVRRRIELGLSQKFLARHLGISPATLSRLETGRTANSSPYWERVSGGLEQLASARRWSREVRQRLAIHRISIKKLALVSGIDERALTRAMSATPFPPTSSMRRRIEIALEKISPAQTSKTQVPHSSRR
jgi:nucleoside phosphorylase/DNA-binding XRE family transcriptional regulator